MDEFSTSAARQRLPRVWREYLGFLRSPELPERREAFGPEARGEVGWLLILDLLLTFLMVGGFLAIAAAGFDFPQNVNDFADPEMAIFAILLAPPLEELVFRSWLVGERMALIAAAGIGALFLMLNVPAAIVLLDSLAVVVLSLASVVGALLAAAISWRRRGTVPDFYRQLFPLFFWASCIVFAVIHLTNYEGAMHAFMLFLVLPQFVTGSILAFARVRYGMWANISLHAAHNAALVVLASIFG